MELGYGKGITFSSVSFEQTSELMGKYLPFYLLTDLLTTCYSPEGVPFTEIYGKHAKAEILNPILNQTYDFFKSFFTEIRDVFPDEYIHLGMDEVYYDCWQSNPDIAKFMQEKGFVNVSQVEQYYVRRTLDNVRDIGYKYMTWQDPVDNGVKVSPLHGCDVRLFRSPIPSFAIVLGPLLLLAIVVSA